MRKDKIDLIWGMLILVIISASILAICLIDQGVWIGSGFMNPKNGLLYYLFIAILFVMIVASALVIIGVIISDNFFEKFNKVFNKNER